MPPPLALGLQFVEHGFGVLARNAVLVFSPFAREREVERVDAGVDGMMSCAHLGPKLAA